MKQETKIIHLGDLHLGIKFHKRSLILDQRHVLNQIVDLADTHKASVVIAGDVFDTVNPSIEAQELWFDFIDKLASLNRKHNTKTLVISGNHDSANRLGLARNFCKEGNIYISDPGVFYEIWEINGIKFVGVPFTKPVEINSAMKTDFEDYDSAYKYLLTLVKENCGVDPKTSVLIAHQTFEGGRTGESEFKPFMSDAVSLNSVKEYSVVMAGHLHAYQVLGNVMYSGSLLPYAFGDDYNAGITLWTYNNDSWSSERLPLNLLHPLKLIQGSLSACLAEEDTEEGSYIKVKLVDCLHFDEALRLLQDKFKFLLAVTTDSAEDWVADLDKPVGTFQNVQEAIDAFCEFMEIPKFTGNKKKLMEEAINAFTKNEN